MGVKLGVLLLMVGAVVNSRRIYELQSYVKTPFGSAVDRASMKILQESFKETADTNLIASPLGALILLMQYAGGAEKDVESDIEVRNEIVKYLAQNQYGSEDSYPKLLTDYYQLCRRNNNYDRNLLSLQNKLYVSKDYKLNENFKSISQVNLLGEVDKLDFTDKKAAAAIINQWAEERTNGNIKNAVSDDTISSDAAVVLLNVIFFQGRWHVPFKKENTTERDFHVDKSTTVRKQFMHLSSSLFYHSSKSLNAKMIELPYQEGFRMIVVLPNEVDGLPHVLEKVAENGLLDEVFELQPFNMKVRLYIPKFEIRSSLKLKSTLQKVGVPKIFTVPVHGIVDKSVKVDSVFQNAFVKVDEEGATAGAFTGFVIVPISDPPPPPQYIDFHVDRPFLFTIMYNDIVLFTGTYTH